MLSTRKSLYIIQFHENKNFFFLNSRYKMICLILFNAARCRRDTAAIDYFQLEQQETISLDAAAVKGRDDAR